MEYRVKRVEEGPFKNIAYRVSGNGFPVMLVHGFPMDGKIWDYQAKKLSEHFRIILPDLPGGGQSPRIPGVTIEQMAESLYAILIQEKIDQCVLIGHSMGGYSTLAFAEKHPEQLKGFGLFHSSAFADSEERKNGRLRSEQMMKEYGGGAFLRQMMPNLFGKNFRKDNKEIVRTLIKSKENTEVELLTDYYEAMRRRPDRTEVLKKSQVPVLFFLGKEDTAAPLEEMLKQISLPVVSEVHLFENVGHMGMIEIPDSSTVILEHFIQFCIDYPFKTGQRLQ